MGMSEHFGPENEVERLLTSGEAPAVSPQQAALDRARLIAAVQADVPVPAVAGDDPSTAGEPAAAKSRRTGRRPGRRGRLVVAVVAGVVLAGTGGGLAAAFLSRSAPSDEGMVRCFAVATPSFEDESLFVDAGFASGPGEGPASAAQAAVDVCGVLWANGDLLAAPPYKPAVPPEPGQAPALPVPELNACVLPEGYVGVFPGPDGTCAALGLPESSLTP